MTIPLLPPKTEPMIDESKFAALNWLVFFDQVAAGDAGTAWTPTFTGLTETGTATKTGTYYRVSQRLVYYRIIITPATDTSAVLGTTYCNNFPLTMLANGANITCSGFTAAVAGSTASDKRIYTASWSAITSPITIVGLLEVR
jgi:hypothetical protein